MFSPDASIFLSDKWNNLYYPGDGPQRGVGNEDEGPPLDGADIDLQVRVRLNLTNIVTSRGVPVKEATIKFDSDTGMFNISRIERQQNACLVLQFLGINRRINPCTCVANGVIPRDLCAGGAVGSTAIVKAKWEGDGHPAFPELVMISRTLFKVHCGFSHPVLTDREEALEASRKKRGGDGAGAGPSADDGSAGAEGADITPGPSFAVDHPGISCVYKLDLLDRTKNYGKGVQARLLAMETWSAQHDVLDAVEVRGSRHGLCACKCASAITCLCQCIQSCSHET